MIQVNKVQRLANKLKTINWAKFSIPAILVFSASLAILMFGENVKAQWWVNDDHEIVYFLGSDHVLRANEIFQTLITKTEVGHYLTFPRFRPAYYTLRLMECWLWGGDNPAMWYAFRIFIFAAFISTFWFLISEKAGFLFGGLISLYMTSFQYWMDIVARLGPSEIYGALGLILFGIGIYIIHKNNRIMGWWMILLGTIICSGSKENFLFLFFPLIYIIWSFYKKGKLDFARSALSFLAVGWTSWIAYVVIVTTRSLGGDIYGNSVGIRDKLHLMISLFQRFDVLALGLLCSILFFLLAWFYLRKQAIPDYIKETGLMVFIITLAYISQIFIYNGEWPTETRYDFPGLLIWPLFLALFINLVQRIIILSKFRKFLVGFNILMLLFISGLIFQHVPNIREAQNRSRENVIKTSAFSTKMENLARIGIQNPKDSLIIQADDAGWDYEPVFSYLRFLRFYGAKNTVAFLWAGPEPKKIGNKFDHVLAVDLRDLSLYGKNPTKLPVNDHDFTPLPDVIKKTDTQCILIIISGQPGMKCPIEVISNWR